jgi:hypothetical protein
VARSKRNRTGDRAGKPADAGNGTPREGAADDAGTEDTLSTTETSDTVAPEGEPAAPSPWEGAGGADTPREEDAVSTAPEDEAVAPDVAGPDTPPAPAGGDDTVATPEPPVTEDTLTAEALSDPAMADTAPDDGAPDETTRADTLSDDPLAGDTRRDAAAGDTPSAPKPGDEPQVVRETVVERKGGLFPMVLGGVIAAALGYGAAQYSDGRLPFLPQPEPDPFIAETRGALASQQDRLAALEGELSQTRDAVQGIDLQPISSGLAGVEESLAGVEGRLAQTRDRVAGFEDALAAFDSRLTELEKQPMVEAVSPEAIAAYERELDELRGAIQQQREDVAAQSAEIERMAQEAMASEQNAEAQAQLAETRGALAELTALLQEGQPFSGPLATLRENGVTVPPALAETAEDGVPTLPALAEAFPDAARVALRTARSGSEQQSGGVGSFLQRQLGARSVQPREGDDPDAVLSRAEAAVTSGNLETALSEIAALPEPARDAMADWTAAAETRRDAQAAAGDLARQINNE